jgi:hypothetical protein
MLTVETIGRIRREHFIKGKTIREIARDLKVSRNTVRKVLRSGATSFEYERDVQPRPKLGRWTADLENVLSANATKPAREQLTLIRIFEELRGRGYDGGYDAVRRYARQWAKQHGQAIAAAYVVLAGTRSDRRCLVERSGLVSDVVRPRSFSPSSSAVRQGRSAPAFCRNTSVLDAAAPRCTTRLENTHGTEFRELLYRWHPWFGLYVCIHEAIDKSDGIVFRCSQSGADADRWLEVPAWMFDRTACSRVRAAADAHVDLAALMALATLLGHALNERSASSNAPLSGAPRLSRDPNRGELHATSHEAEIGARPRAAADRSVRRRPAERDRRHASVVRPAEGDTSGSDELDNTVALGARATSAGLGR